jgi:hypothetical protein
MKKIHHCHHATRWYSNGEGLKPKETRCNAPKTTRSRSSTYRINSQEVSVPINFRTTSRENNRISLDIYKPHEVTLPTNQESSQSEVPTSGYGRITEGCTFWNFWTACKSGNKTATTPSFGLRLRWMSTRGKGNFIKFSIEQYFGICSVMYTGKIHEKEEAATWWEQDSGDEDDDNEEKLGQCFHWTTQDEIHKFGTKQRPQEHCQKKAQVGNIRR